MIETVTHHEKYYREPGARLRALYQAPGPQDSKAAIEIHLTDSGRVLRHGWPAQRLVSCRLCSNPSPRALGDSPGVETCHHHFEGRLLFADQSFDVVILHNTIDDLLTATPGLAPRTLLDLWFTEAFRLLRPGGLVIGCGTNWASPRLWLSNAGGSPLPRPFWRRFIGISGYRSALSRSGFTEPQIFNLVPDAHAPRSIISTQPELSRRAFRRELDIMRDSLSPLSFFLRRLIVAAALNRYFERTVFFWGNKPC